MTTKIHAAPLLALAFTLSAAMLARSQSPASRSTIPPPRPQGPCDLYAAAGDPCVAAHSTTRALYAAYNGPLYQVRRQSDGKTLDIGVVPPSAAPFPDPGGYAGAAAQDRFCANTICWITRIYDQSPRHNDLTQAPRGAFSGPALGGRNNLPLANMAPVMIMGHKVYGVFIEPGMGLRDDDTKGTAVDDQAEGQYWVVDGHHFNSGCCFDYGNAEIDSHDDDAGTMEAAYFGDAPSWYHGNLPGPWAMTDQENNLVGCVNPNGSRLCVKLPNLAWRFVTAIANGEPHRWASMAGDAQRGALSLLFSGPRVGPAYDPMRKQGAILLGNGGDNSNGSQGTFYEGAMTAAGTFPSYATEQAVQANIVAAGYGVLPLSLAPASAVAAPPGLQTFSPGSSQLTTVAFNNTTASPAAYIKLSLSLPSRQWRSVLSGAAASSKAFSGPLAPGRSVSATFRVTSPAAAFNGDLVADAWWINPSTGRKHFLAVSEQVRNVSPVRINEFRISSGPPANPSNSFIELYNAGPRRVDISHWTLTLRPAQQAIFSHVQIPARTQLASRSFYLLGLSNSGLAAPARPGDRIIYVRSTAGMRAGDSIYIGSGASAELRRIRSLGSAAAIPTTLWQPLPDGPITLPAGSTDVPVMSVAGFKVGQKIALGYGATFPAGPVRLEHYELATVTGIGTPGTQAYLAAAAPAGSASLKVTSVRNISPGDTIRLDIASVGHGIETVTVAKVGTGESRTQLLAAASPGATHIQLRSVKGFVVGDQMAVGNAPHQATVTITAIGAAGPAGVDFQPALARPFARGAQVSDLGSGLALAAPLRFNHSSNLPFSDRGTGIGFTPATAFVHLSDEPVQALGAGITLDRPLAKPHPIHAVVRDPAVRTAGYQGPPAPDQWFGGPELITRAPLFGRIIPVREGSMVLRNAGGLVVDSLNYGGLADPWAAEGYQAASGLGKSGCYAVAPGAPLGFWFFAPRRAFDTSTGRFPDGFNSDSNCRDFHASPATILAAAAPAGAAGIKVAGVAGFRVGQTIRIGAGANYETAVIAAVGAPGASALRAATAVGAKVVPVANAIGFRPGETVSIGSGADFETAVVASVRWFRGPLLTVATPLTSPHAAGERISATGITLAAPLARAHARGAEVTGRRATPGAPNRYSAVRR